MSLNSKIEWTDATWNPVTGCTKVSPGCKNCYAETFAERWRNIKGHPYEQGFDLRLWEDRIELPLQWKQPKRIFVNSMSDLFHERVPDEFIGRVFDTMCMASHHIFQLLTKRSERMMEWVSARYRFVNESSSTKGLLPKHIWLGVSVENQKYTLRIKHLQKTPCRGRFLSIEPLLDAVELNSSQLRGIHWVIVGGESGPGARPMDPDWAMNIRKSCDRSSVPLCFKQWGAFNSRGQRVGKKNAGRRLEGRTWNDMPVILATG